MGQCFSRRLMAAVLAGVSVTAVAVPMSEASAQSAARANFNIPDQNTTAALEQFGRQSGQSVMFDPARLIGARSRGIRGSFTAENALSRLLAGTGFTWRRANTNTFVIEADGARSGEAQAGGAAADSESADAGATPEILVVGNRSVNADIRRTEDDVQPYVVLGADEIRQSAAGNIEELLRTRLPMNTSQEANIQNSSSLLGNQSSIDLRGLGSNQTLILVDGRRIPNVNTGGSFSQGDINGIPLSTIERIEILPSTASGIYGGGATGGVINIITKRNYTGYEISGSYGSSFRGDASTYRIGLNAGLSLEEGRTHILVSAYHSQTDPLLVGDRDFAGRGRALQLANNPAAFFGATIPPQGLTSNIRSQNGSNLVLDSGVALNSTFTFVPLGYAGPSSDGGLALVGNAGRYDLDIPRAQVGALQTLVSGSETTAATGSIRREFGRRIEAFVDFSWQRSQAEANGTAGIPVRTTLAASAPNNPFTTAIVVSFPATDLVSSSFSESEVLRGVAGIIVRLPGNWTAETDYTWSRSTFNYRTDPAISANPVLANGTLNVMRDLNAFPLDFSPYFTSTPRRVEGPFVTQFNEIAARASGPALALPGGDVTLSALASYRTEKALPGYSDLFTANTAIYYPPRSQDVSSVYLEANLPLVSGRNALPFVQLFEIRASVRYDEYRTLSSDPASINLTSRSDAIPALRSRANRVDATSYTVGMRFSPVDGLIFRASYGTGFLPPSISQIVPSVRTDQSTNQIDPKRGGVNGPIGPFTLTGGGNPDLIPEDSESFSAGVVLSPRALPGFRVSVDYTHIEKTNEIESLSIQDIILLEDILPGRVTRAPLTPADAALGYTGGRITAIDTSAANISTVELDAFDIQIDYAWRTPSVGDFRIYAIATWQPNLESRFTPAAAVVDTVGFLGGPLEWRGNIGITWNKGPWTIGWNAQYYDSYRIYSASTLASAAASIVLNQGSERIPSQTYHDVFVRARLGEFIDSGFLNDTDVTLSIQNLFDESPPILATTAPSGGYSSYGDPRLRRFLVEVRTRF